MSFIIACFVVCLILLILIIFAFSRMDCDLELLAKIAFGRSIDNYKDKVVWITGASSGIGEELAYLLAGVNVKLVLSGTNLEALNRVAKKCVSIANAKESNVLVLQFDIVDTSCHAQMLTQVLEHFKRLDILVNNAGRSQRDAPFGEVELSVDRAMFDVNVFGTISLSRLVLRHFLEHNPEGQFAVTSSTTGIMGMPLAGTYSATKHALHGYFESLRLELGSKKITITLLCVGATHSNIANNAFTSKLGDTYGQDTKDGRQARMDTVRCVHLMALAIINRMDRVWIAPPLILMLHYFTQYLGPIARKILPKKVTEERLQQHFRKF